MLLAFGGPFDLGFIALAAIMLFGKNLPQVARKVGRGWAEFKKSISGIQSEFNSVIYTDNPSTSAYSSRSSSSSYSDPIDDYEEQTAPKFIPPPAEPKV